MANKSFIRKRILAPRSAVSADALGVMPTRLRAIGDTWDYIDDGMRQDGAPGLGLSDDALRLIARKLGIPFLGAKLLSREITSEDLREWEAWPHRRSLAKICEIEAENEVKRAEGAV